MFSRLRAAYAYLGYLTFQAIGSMYLAAGTLIGFEALAMLIGYATIWPVGIPFAIIGIGLWAVIRQRLGRHGTDADGDTDAEAETTQGAGEDRDDVSAAR